MKKRILLLFFTLSCSLSAQEGISLTGTVYGEDGSSIKYASIINITTNKHGTTSDENGDFYLKTRKNFEDEIQINALGFYELKTTLADFVKLAKAESIILKEKPIDLGEVKVSGERYELNYIGKSTQLLKRTDSSYFSDPMSEGPGYSEGVYVVPHRKTEGLIDKIHFYVTADGSLNQPFTIRLLRSNGKLKNNQGYKIDGFDDMTDSSLLVQKVRAGWNTFELYDSDIYVDSRPFFILFTTVETLEEAKTRELNESVQSINLGAFADRKPNEIYKALSFNGIILYLANDRVKTPIPAVYLEYSKLSKK